MGHGDNIPGNVNTNEFDLNNGGWILIAVLFCNIAILIICMVIQHCLAERKYMKLDELYKKDLNDKEKLLLAKYRKLNGTEQTIIDDTIKTLTENKVETKHKDDGN